MPQLWHGPPHNAVRRKTPRPQLPRHAGVGREEEKELICLFPALDYAAQPPTSPVGDTSPRLLPAQLSKPGAPQCCQCRVPQPHHVTRAQPSTPHGTATRAVPSTVRGSRLREGAWAEPSAQLSAQICLQSHLSHPVGWSPTDEPHAITSLGWPCPAPQGSCQPRLQASSLSSFCPALYHLGQSLLDHLAFPGSVSGSQGQGGGGCAEGTPAAPRCPGTLQLAVCRVHSPSSAPQSPLLAQLQLSWRSPAWLRNPKAGPPASAEINPRPRWRRECVFGSLSTSSSCPVAH